MGESLAPRSDFPAAEEATYLNAASIGLTPLPVQEEVLAFQREVGGRGTIGFDDDAETRAYEGAREAASRLIGAGAPTDVAITTSITEALGQLAWWLRPREGTNVVSVDIEHPSGTYPWMRLAEDTGTEIRLVPASADLLAFGLDAIAELVDDRTAVICVSHVQYATGHLLDLAALASVAHAHDALLVVDATQSAGMVPIDVVASDVDVLVAAGYKWLCGAFGAAICYMRPDVAARFRPPFVGWRSTVDPFAFDATRMPLARGVRAMEYSTVAYGSGIALGAAVRYLLRFGIDSILAHDLRLAARLMDGLAALGVTVLTPKREDRRGSIVLARFPGREARTVYARLTDAGVHTSFRLDGIRFAPHLYNHEEDVDGALRGVERILSSPGD